MCCKSSKQQTFFHLEQLQLLSKSILHGKLDFDARFVGWLFSLFQGHGIGMAGDSFSVGFRCFVHCESVLQRIKVVAFELRHFVSSLKRDVSIPVVILRQLVQNALQSWVFGRNVEKICNVEPSIVASSTFDNKRIKSHKDHASK